MKIPRIALLLMFLFIVVGAFARPYKISVSLNGRNNDPNSDNFGLCHYTIWDENGTTALWSGYSQCPERLRRIPPGGIISVGQVSQTSPFGQALLKAGLRESDLKDVKIDKFKESDVMEEQKAVPQNRRNIRNN